ncbi:MAG: hypothetical protein V1776_00435 [Candidatus Diapherotrites archaeon]
MTKTQMVKIVVYAPKTNVDSILDMFHQQGGGSYGDGKYVGCAFLTFGHGTWIALKGSKPFKGRLNKREMSQEVKIETTLPKSSAERVIKLIRSIHPYEEPIIEMYPLESIEEEKTKSGKVEVLKYK